MRSETAHDLLDSDASLLVVVRLGLLHWHVPEGLRNCQEGHVCIAPHGGWPTGDTGRRGVHPHCPVGFQRYEVRVTRAMNSPSRITQANEFGAHVLSSGVVHAALAFLVVGNSVTRQWLVALRSCPLPRVGRPCPLLTQRRPWEWSSGIWALENLAQDDETLAVRRPLACEDVDVRDLPTDRDP